MEHPPVYKFTRSTYRDDFLSGRSIRVGTLTEFRDLDQPPFAHEAPRPHIPKGGIGDFLEGRTVLEFDRFNPLSEQDRGRARATNSSAGFDLVGNALRQMIGFDTTPDSDVSIKNSVCISQVPNIFIFCCSNDLSNKTIDRMRTDSEAFGGVPYDIAIPILDVNGFLNAMTFAVCQKMKMWGEIRNAGGPVEYRDTVCRVGNTWVSPSPLQKHSFFATQNEFRFLIDQPIETSQKAIFVDLNCDTTSMFGTPIEL